MNKVSLISLIFPITSLMMLFILATDTKADQSEVSVGVLEPVLTAKTNACVVDQTLKAKISNNNAVMDLQAQSYVDTDSVNLDDEGILFAENSNYTTYPGTYTSTIFWEATDSV
ncbi:hypothetical protein [Companilactobacillus kedongensis]|uniref:hypothetical protein n=1 Tax=Companilactobacillus kedongensis TaxID=2486004 RepID=UPI000F77FA9A|nr:hypothetical protein [Companilactobacillus kedongensis]